MRVWLRLIRLPNTFTTWIDVMAGAALAIFGAETLGLIPVRESMLQGGGTPTWIAWPVALAAFSASLFYAGGMALNDWADRERDRTLHPERPIPSGLLSAPRVLVVSLILFVLALVAAQFISMFAHAAGAATLLAIVLYDLAVKDRPRLAALAMGCCRGLSMSLGVMAGFASIEVSPPLWTWAIWIGPLAYAFLVATVTTLSQFEDVDPSAVEKNLTRGLLLALWIFPAFLAPDWIDRIALALMALIIAHWVLRPSLRQPPIWGLVVRNGVFTLVFYGALWAAARGRYEVAVAALIVFVMVRFTARLLAQRGA